MPNNLDAQRTYAIIGTGGCGKTSIAEMLLFQAGVTKRLGKIEEGTTSLDYEPEEIKRHGSIQPSLATFIHNDARHFMLDLPGGNNFIGDLAYLLKAVDSVIFVIDAVDGVRPLTKKHWAAVKEARLPACCFINKIDRDRADFDKAFQGLSAKLGMKTVPLFVPYGEPQEIKGLIDVLKGKVLIIAENGKAEEKDIPGELNDEITLLRDVAIENIAESDEELMEKYLEEGSLSETDIKQGLRKGVLSGNLIPVVAGSALENKGGEQLFSIIENLLASPLDHAPFEGTEDTSRASQADSPPSCFVFKTLSDPFTGKLNLVRVISGQISAESSLKNMSCGETERLGTPVLLVGKEQTQVKEAFGPGSLVALAKLKNTKTGDTLCDEKSPFTVALPKLPAPLISYALEPKEKGDEDKVYSAIQKIIEEDITLKLTRDSETGDILLSGMGQLHIELAVEKAKRRYKVDIILNTPKVPYRETIKATAKVQGRHKKQSGGKGQFGDCWIELSPLPRGTGYEFEDAIVGGVIPRQYIPAIDKGIQESAARGFLAGYPIVDCKVKVYDGSYHTVDSSEMAFKIAGSLAFKKGMEQCKAVLLEPIVTMAVSTPDEFMGDIIGDLSSRRGKVLGSDSIDGITEVKAHIPMNEILRYASDLRSMTGGQGTFTLEFSHYEEAPPQVVEKVVGEYKKNKADE
ncbi:elongation factor G [Desulfovibrio litoralis]|uniref:Elongation factor G n=1 Tax=Desulfovibrio litoralis DSM 11393 TaxID=1121455 RepID=A0A1M7RY56_9BACT|nr:elongation factor G [Desulfovibrio litoralis]SHN51110.1 translation elongation factor 2 (EF-2/EF-G) [Desulfovibrio litoralis DSM 11393]